MLREDTPNGFPESLKRYNPNDPTIIYHGQIVLEKEDYEVFIDGKISFDWLPEIRLTFEGAIPDTDIYHDFLGFNLSKQPLRVRADNIDFGKGEITQFVNGKYSGRIIGEKAIGDLNAQVEKITFVIPNLKSISGEAVSWDGNYYSNKRLTLDNMDYSIILEENVAYKESKDQLQNTGGYCIQYYGEAVKKAGLFTYSEATSLAQSLSTFLSFIVGRRTSLLFLTGMSRKSNVWNDFSTNIVDRYKPVSSWYHRDKQMDLKALWKTFSFIWNDQKQVSNLKNVISFYLESNCNKVFIENCIVLSQAAMELIYNWEFVEKGLGKETDYAQVKLTKLVENLMLSTDIPQSLNYLKQLENVVFVDKLFSPRPKITLAAEAFLEIRNAIIHGNTWRRENLGKISTHARIDAWILGNWYIELSILKILGYNGLYNNRTVSMKIDYSSMEPVPWV
ncbi:hypothetical protein [Dyadobacter sp.]|uniref:hypothetical protein n=1 Tax=Dyadobacter sp. TaxID=1914288 RepID=UPI003F71CC0B